jgi:hypothetical protein
VNDAKLEAEIVAVLRDCPGSLTPDCIRRILQAGRGVRVHNAEVEAVLVDLMEQDRVSRRDGVRGTRVTYRFKAGTNGRSLRP